MGADQNFFRNRSVGLYPRNHLKPSHLGNERIAMDKLSLSNNALGNYAEAKRVETQNWTAETGQTGSTLRSDRSHRSDRWKGPVRPVASRKLGNKTSKGRPNTHVWEPSPPHDFSPFFPGCGSGSPTSTTRIHATVRRRVVSLLAPACGHMRTTFKEGEGEVHSPGRSGT